MRKLSNTGHFISTRIGQAIGDYNLIEEKDKKNGFCMQRLRSRQNPRKTF
ncbi:MAG: hypothetical protein ISS45_10680 [Candidatus Omnitrophica bacterium]|nr:hypothetical protein [Candidatus Omnitrophota bacterium]